MSKHGSIRFSAKVNQKVVVELHSTILCVDINNEHHGTLVAHFWVELLVPWRKQGSGDHKPFSIQRELKHLWSTFNTLTLSISHSWLNRKLLILSYFYGSTLLNGATKEDLASEFRVPSVSDVILSDVTM